VRNQGPELIEPIVRAEASRLSNAPAGIDRRAAARAALRKVVQVAVR
jgi:hypothetical protein